MDDLEDAYDDGDGGDDDLDAVVLLVECECGDVFEWRPGREEPDAQCPRCRGRDIA